MATPGVGIQSFMRVGKETTYGTASTAYSSIQIMTESLRNQSNLTEGNRNLGRLGRSGTTLRQRRGVGDFTIDAKYEGLEELFRQFFGDYTGQDGEPVANARTHDFLPSTSRQIGLSVEVHQDNLAWEFLGGKPNQCNFLFTNEVLAVTLGQVSKHAQIITALAASAQTFPSAPDVNSLENTNGLVFLLDAGAFVATQVELSCAFPHTEDRESLGVRDILEPLISDLFVVSGTIEREVEDDVLALKFINNTVGAMDLKYTSDEFITGSTEYSLQVKCDEVVFGEAKGPTDGPGPITESIPFTARIPASGDFFRLTLVNGTTVLT